MKVLSAGATIGLLILIGASLALWVQGPVEDSSVEEMYQMLYLVAWACGGFVLAITGLGFVVAWLTERRERPSSEAEPPPFH